MVVTIEQDVEAAAAAAECVVETHRRLVEFLRPGLLFAEIDAFVARCLRDMDAKSCFLKYRIPGHPPFPSHSCLSVNDCVVHGTHVMADEPIKPGDLLSIDIGVSRRGWIGDAAWTYAIGEATDEMRKLMRCGRESLAEGIEAMQANAPLVDWARAVQGCVEGRYGFHLVRGLGGHGYGTKMHDAPFVSNVVPRSPAEWPEASSRFRPGMLIAVEPMIAVGTPETKSAPRSWPIFTADGSLAVHYEADVLITPDGPRNLTVGMQELPDVVG